MEAGKYPLCHQTIDEGNLWQQDQKPATLQMLQGYSGGLRLDQKCDKERHDQHHRYFKLENEQSLFLAQVRGSTFSLYPMGEDYCPFKPHHHFMAEKMRETMLV